MLNPSKARALGEVYSSKNSDSTKLNRAIKEYFGGNYILCSKNVHLQEHDI